MNTLRSIFAGAALLALPAEAQDQHHWIETDDPAPESAYTYIEVQADVSVTIRDIGRPLQRRLVTRLKRKDQRNGFRQSGCRHFSLRLARCADGLLELGPEKSWLFPTQMRRESLNFLGG